MSEKDAFPLFPVATHKFIVMSICTFTIYDFYWFYQTWKRIRKTGEALSPFWRTFFAPVWAFSLFRRIRDLAASEGVVTPWNPTGLASLFLLLSGLLPILSLFGLLPDPLSLLTFATFAPMIPIQQAAEQVNDRALGVTEDRNRHYGAWNILTIVVGGLLFAIVVVGSFMAGSGVVILRP